MSSGAQERCRDRMHERRELAAEDELCRDMVVVVTAEGGLSEPIADMFDHLNYSSYRSHRERLTASQAIRVFVGLEIGTLEDCERWEKRYEQDLLR